MSSSACAKCKRGGAAEGDSWCLGCSALESAQSSLKANWWSQSHRRLGEEIVIQASKQLRAVKNLDSSLQSFNDSFEARLRKTAAQTGGHQRPPEPPLPPRVAPILAEAPQPPTVKVEVKAEPRAATGYFQPDSSPSPDYGNDTPSEQEEQEEAGSPDKQPADSPRPRHRPEGNSGAARGHSSHRGHRDRSRTPRPRRQRGPRPGHRGGVKHQKRYREYSGHQGHFHRPLRGEEATISQRRDRSVLASDL